MAKEKTLATKLLRGRKIDFETLPYDATERDAAKIAHSLGLPAGSVFKTLVVDRPPKKPLLVMVPANHRLNLKLLAKAVGDKKLSMATQLEAEKLTGLQVGGISPLALLNRGFMMWADCTLTDWESICISSGKRGMQIRLAPADLLKIAKIRLVELSEPVD